MPCCCSDPNADAPNRCCGDPILGERCICTPYKDGCIMSAQIMAIIAAILSGYTAMNLVWFLWGGFILGPILVLLNLVGLILFQIVWCHREAGCYFYVTGSFAIVNSLSMLAIAISFGVLYWDCCRESLSIVLSVTVLGSLLWAIAAGQTFHYVKSGKLARANAEYANREVNAEVVDVEVAEPDGNPMGKNN